MQRCMWGVSREQMTEWKADLGRGLRVYPQPTDHDTEAGATPGPEGPRQTLGLGIWGPGHLGILMPLMFSFEVVVLKNNKKNVSSFSSAYLLSLKETLGFPRSPFVGLALKS